MNAILLIDKPAGWTSMDVCAKLRGAFHEKRVGHSGTLDPMATGLLVVFLGRATRAVEFAEADAKTYEASIRLGTVTDTQDITGEIISSAPVSVTEAEFDAALAGFRGEIEQLPPMYSAIKVNGKPLYKTARKGGEVERKPRRVTIFALERNGPLGEDTPLCVRCSKGTYIRTLCHDLGAALGCGGCMSALRRTEAGAFSLRDAHSLAEAVTLAEQGRGGELLLPVDGMFPTAKPLKLTPMQEKAVRNGAAYPSRLPEGDYRLYSAATGEFLALARQEKGRMSPVKSFFEV